MQRINAPIQKAIDLYNGRDLLQEGCFKLAVITDAGMFDGASTQAAMEADEIVEQGSQEDKYKVDVRKPRHRIGDCRTRPTQEKRWRAWARTKITRASHLMLEDDEEFPVIEGRTEKDVGWMKVQLVGLVPDFYANLRDPSLWHVQYIRPPDIATA
ncbi:hypothetical protein O1611_g4040 [Lasiodiplodia mahajangana]|uniref:Uncharacterized protein n=1 Tax=Lasiodiplodia mahajangana TaxID=1108764 RepID=A0ACC2JQ05_9PEZI|nr:hypothetical protein O1611_g4040 [Lasiodiplodia mahajangana]